MSRNRLVALALVVLSLAVAAPAHAVLITVNFTWGSVGSFSFDSSIIPDGGGSVGDLSLNTDYVSDITFTDVWGSAWTSSNSGVNYLAFDSSGNLTEWAIGGDVNGIYNDLFATPSVTDFRVSFLGGQYLRQARSSTGFVSTPGTFVWSFSPQPPYSGAAPEPGTLAMFAPGLLALGLVRRRKS